MNIIFLTVAHISDLNQTGIYEDLLREFISHGHIVDVVCPLEKSQGGQTRVIQSCGARILKIKIGNFQKTNFFEKGISTFLLEGQFINGIKKYYQDHKYDLVIYSTPPITFANVVSYIKSRDHATSYLLLKDIFPQNAIDLQILSNQNPIYWWFKHKERKLYKLSDFIGCMSLENIQYILKHNNFISSDKVHVSPNSISLDRGMVNQANKYKTRQKYNIPPDAIVFIYGGNLGRPQGIPYIIESLRLNANKSDRFFVICGAGTEYHLLEDFINNESPNNIILLPSLKKSEYDYIVSACDVGLIFLDKRFTIPNVPSRLLDYLKSSIPVLAATDAATDLRNMIVEGNFGWWCFSDEPKDYLQLVNEICSESNDMLTKGANGRQYLKDNFLSSNSYEIIINKTNIDGKIRR